MCMVWESCHAQVIYLALAVNAFVVRIAVFLAKEPSVVMDFIVRSAGCVTRFWQQSLTALSNVSSWCAKCVQDTALACLDSVVGGICMQGEFHRTTRYLPSVAIVQRFI
jgi:hypothetical protein